MSSVEFEPTISAGERPQTYVLVRAATGTGRQNYRLLISSYAECEVVKTIYIYVSIQPLG